MYCGNKVHDDNCPNNHVFKINISNEQAKELEEYIKNLTHDSITIWSDYEPGVYMVSQKPWGHERILHSDDTCVVKQIYVKAGHRLSLQYHKEKIETMFLVGGMGYIQLGDSQVPFRMNKLIPVLIEPHRVHRLMAAPDQDCLVIEVSSTELSDVVRLEDDYGR